MKLYRFSPIKSHDETFKALNYVYETTHALTHKVLGEYLQNLGNIVIFCHYDDEFEYLDNFKKQITIDDDNINNKYFKLKDQIIIDRDGDRPGATLRYLYIRPPDPWRAQVGDVDFYLEPSRYKDLKDQISNGTAKKGLRIFPRDDLDMIEVYDPDFDVLAYIRPKHI